MKSDSLGDRMKADYENRTRFALPRRIEVFNYLVWRQKDATRNSIQMAAQACFPQDRLQGKSSDQLQEMLFGEQGVNWNNYPPGAKRGRAVVVREIEKDVEYVDGRTGETSVARGVKRREWVAVDPPIFTQDRAWLEAHIPGRGG